MTKKPNAKAIIEKLKKPQRKPVLVTYRIDEEIKDEFTEVCEKNEISPAKAVEELMRGFVEDTKRK